MIEKSCWVVYAVFSVVAGGVNSMSSEGSEREFKIDSILRAIRRRAIIDKTSKRKVIRGVNPLELRERPKEGKYLLKR